MRRQESTREGGGVWCGWWSLVRMVEFGADGGVWWSLVRMEGRRASEGNSDSATTGDHGLPSGRAGQTQSNRCI
jgi:hypothetical protein